MTTSFRRVFLDRDFIEDKDGFMYCVVGYVHPPNRVLAYLKYVPSNKENIRTIWFRGGIRYNRVLEYYSSVAVAESFKILEKTKPHYIYYDEVFNIKFIGIPLSEIGKHYLPEARLKEIVEQGTSDALERDLVELTEFLCNESGIKLNYFGISGSILLRIHNPKYSDMDLTIYGIRESWKLLEIIKDITEKQNIIALPSEDVLKKWAFEVSKHHPLTPKEAFRMYVEKRTRLMYKGCRIFSLHPILLPHEISEKYGDRVYLPKGLAKIRGRVVENKLSIFLPGTYAIDDVEVIEGAKKYCEIREVVTFEGLYSGLLDLDEEFIAYGKVEEVYDKVGEKKFLRLVIGSAEAKGRDYIKPLRWLR